MQAVKEPQTQTAGIKPFGGRGLLVVADDEVHYRDLISSLLRKSLGDDIDIIATDTYSTAIDAIKANAHRLRGVVSDINYYQTPESIDTDRCGLWIIGEVNKVNPQTPVVIQSSLKEYGEHPAIKGRAAFIHKDDLEARGVDIFRRVFGHKLNDKI